MRTVRRMPNSIRLRKAVCPSKKCASIRGNHLWAWCITSKELGWSVIDSLVDFHLVQEFEDAQGNPKFGLHEVILDYCLKTSQTGHNPSRITGVPESGLGTVIEGRRV